MPFNIIRIPGHTNIVSDQTDDVLDIVGGPGIVISTNAAIDTITISALGAGLSGLGYTGSSGFTGSQGVTGYAGSQGVTGNIGYTGSSGATGFVGSVGESGYTGSKGNTGGLGDIGYTGSSGVEGYTGSQGNLGFSGSQGLEGFTGSQGIQGIQGAIGYYGSQGDLGYAGSQGPTGNQGIQGIQGVTGFTGSSGIQGVAGYTGSQGITGFTGSQGTQGTEGYTGSVGTTGFTGSQGATGYDGSKGDTGLGFAIAKSYSSVANLLADTSPTGIVSGQFAIVETGNVNDPENSRLYLWNGTVYSYTSDLSGNIGITGPQGVTGYTGSQGSPGVTGDLGYTGSASTVIGYTGSQGLTGYDGSFGLIGYTGSQGEIGFTGSVGVTGFTGSIGDTGFTGSQGVQGYAGSQGDQGYAGSQGITGFTGSHGNVGFTGSMGLTGFAGATGYTGSQGDTGFIGSQGDIGYTGSAITGYTGSAAPDYAQDTGEPLGFVERTASQISFDNITRTFAISPASTSYEIYCRGTKYTISNTRTVTIPNLTGLYYIYFDTTGVLQYKTTFFDWPNDCMTAYVYWNADVGAASFVADERHGITLDWQTHEYLHRTRGAAYASGFQASNYLLNQDGSIDTHMQLDIANGVFFDEDLQVDIVHSDSPTANTWEQDLQGPARIPVLYRSGTAWVLNSVTDFAIKGGTALPQYNLNTGGNWSTVDIDNNKYGITFILATNNINYPVLGIIGQESHANEADALAIDFTSLDTTGFPVVEFRPLYKLVYECKNSYGNTVKARLVALQDLRGASVLTITASGISGPGFTGSTGFTGSAGYTGSQGEAGFTGSVGATGYTGSQGDIGFTGSAGDAGSAGATGFTGSSGLTGFTGSTGEIGYTGSVGVAGYTGSQGEAGFTGSFGDTGYTGSQGEIGFTGSAGLTGFTGSNGEIGFTGSSGINGYSGSVGDIGFTGSAGSSGYTGSQGETGFTGSQGDIGYSGSFGVTGFTGSFGITGYTGSQGDIGFTGSFGTTGYTGSFGITGYTGSVGPIAGNNTEIIFNDDGVAGAESVFTYDKSTNMMTVQYATLTGTTSTGIDALDVGVVNSSLPNTIASFSANVNNYTQVTLQNKSNGTDATADFVITANNGTDTVNYLDLGIINSGYDPTTPTNSLGNIVYAADGYLYAQGNASNAAQPGGNLVIGTTTVSKTVKIFAGGANSNSVVATFSNTGITGNTNGFAIGYRDIPQVLFSTNATTTATDAGKHYYSTASTNLTLTIANSSTVSFAIGTAINVINGGTGTITIAQGTGVSLYLTGNTTASNRTVSSYGMATILKVAADTWFITGAGVN